ANPHLNRTTSMVYDSGGRVIQSTDPMNLTSNFVYNSLGQPTQAVFPNPGAETVNYTYGANGRTESVSDNRGTTTLAYDTGNDRVASVTDPVTGTVGYTYGLAGERKTMSLPGGGTWTYDYDLWDSFCLFPKDDPDSVSRMLNRVTDDQGRVAEYWIDHYGALKRARTDETFGGGAATQYLKTEYFNERSATGTARGTLAEIKNTWNHFD